MGLASEIPRHAEESSENEDRLDRVFHALANRTRRAMLRRLAEGPAPITELAAPFDMSFPSVSKHLRVLESAGNKGVKVILPEDHVTGDLDKKNAMPSGTDIADDRIGLDIGSRTMDQSTTGIGRSKMVLWNGNGKAKDP